MTATAKRAAPERRAVPWLAGGTAALALVAALVAGPGVLSLWSSRDDAPIGIVSAGNMALALDDACTWSTVSAGQTLGGDCATLTSNPLQWATDTLITWTGTVTVTGDNLHGNLIVTPNVAGTDVASWPGWNYRVYLGNDTSPTGTPGDATTPAVAAVSASTTFRVTMSIDGHASRQYLIVDPNDGASAFTFNIGAPSVVLVQVRP